MTEMHDRYEQASRLLDPLSLMRNRMIEPQWTDHALVYTRTGEDGDAEQITVDLATFERSTSAVPETESAAPTPVGVISPDGALLLFCKDEDVWLRTLKTGEERPLTADGEPGFAWGALFDNCMVRIPLRQAGAELPPVLTAFSPSSRLVLTARTDERAYGTWPVVQHLSPQPRPVLHEIRAALDADDIKENGEAVVIDVATGHRTPLQLPPGAYSTLMSVGADSITWGPDETHFWVLNHRTGDREGQLLEVDVKTGLTRVVVSETAERVYEPNQFLYSLPLVRAIPELDTVVWYSQRDGFGHLYHYRLSTGEYVARLTTGAMTVRDILRVDVERKCLIVVAGSEEDDRNPYWRQVLRVSLAGDGQTLLTPELCDHQLVEPQPAFLRLVFARDEKPVQSISPDGRFCVDHMSTVSEPPVSVLRDLDDGGRIVAELERTDIRALADAGFVAPEQFRVRSEDGTLDLWGTLTLPADPVDPGSIPLVDLMYAGFQTAWQPSGFLGPDIGGRSTSPGIAYGALGIATVVLDGRGTPGRSTEFRQHTQGKLDPSLGLADHVWAITKLAERYPQLDVSRVGVTGFSYGGYNSTRSMLVFPDFFKVAVSGAGVHVPEKMPHGAWAWHVGADVDKNSELYKQLGNTQLVGNLKGKLLLTYGDMDENATPDHTLALMAALVAAGKRFDVKVWPGGNHYTQTGPYMIRSAWDYFVQHLLGEPLPGD